MWKKAATRAATAFLGAPGIARGFGRRTVFTLQDPSYLKTGLSPVISAKTLEFHFGGHHKAYLNKTNELVKGTKYESLPLVELVVASKKDNAVALFNNSAQLWNHSFYWDCMAPVGTTKISDAFEKKLAAEFGSLQEFKKKFTDAAIGNFGSGWTWLVNKNGKLEIWNSSNADTPCANVSERGKPLLTIDVWEHAYYLDHQNRRAEYANKWWEVVDWKFVEGNLK